MAATVNRAIAIDRGTCVGRAHKRAKLTNSSASFAFWKATKTTKTTTTMTADKEKSTTSSSRSTTTETAEPATPLEFTLRVAQLDDHDRLLDFLRQHYYREEPLTIGCEPQQQDAADEEFTMSNIAHGTCVMAMAKRESDEIIVAAVMAGPKDRHEVDHLFEEVETVGAGTKWGRILKILACLERDANVFERFQIERAVHAHALGVHQHYRGHALGYRVMRELMAVARQLNYELFTSDCSSIYSSRLCQRLGMECVHRLLYADYRDEEGNQVFKPPMPHDAIETYAIRL